MPALPATALAQLFTEARTYRTWQPTPLTDEDLTAIYDLLRWGPTSANSCPARFVFVRSAAAKERLLTAVAPANQPKVRAAPVTVIVAYDTRFYDQMPRLSPHDPKLKDVFAQPALAEDTWMRNGSLQGAYLMLAARALGVDCGPMSGFDRATTDALFFSGSTWRSNFLCNLGRGDPAGLHPRAPRLAFNEACEIR